MNLNNIPSGGKLTEADFAPRDPAAWPAGFGQGRHDDDVAPMTRGELLALACVMLLTFLAFLAAVAVAWTRWVA
jgi:hypothetical protein